SARVIIFDAAAPARFRARMRQQYIDKAISYFNEGYACSQSVLLAFAGDYDIDETAAKLISSTFGGGMGRLREKCGALTGAFMVLGLAHGNTDPKDMQTKLAAYDKVRELDKRMKDAFTTTVCAEILAKHAREEQVAERKHHSIICRRVVSETAGMLYDILNGK
ncbi:MAG TPA: C-GCAxxG-C-C family protein, partial [Spirochaetota bacterium]|nr:C-GCAxxG-C-C family protein [Spirochaetota bacterium]